MDASLPAPGRLIGGRYHLERAVAESPHQGVLWLASDTLAAEAPVALRQLPAGSDAEAVRALAGIGDVRGLELLEQALGGDIGPSVRRAAARGLGQLRTADLNEQPRRLVRERALAALEAAAADGEWVVRYAVVVGLESLALDLDPAGDGPALRERTQCVLALLSAPEEDTPVVKLRALQALARTAAPI